MKNAFDLSSLDAAYREEDARLNKANRTLSAAKWRRWGLAFLSGGVLFVLLGASVFYYSGQPGQQKLTEFLAFLSVLVPTSLGSLVSRLVRRRDAAATERAEKLRDDLCRRMLCDERIWQHAVDRVRPGTLTSFPREQWPVHVSRKGKRTILGDTYRISAAIDVTTKGGLALQAGNVTVLTTDSEDGDTIHWRGLVVLAKGHWYQFNETELPEGYPTESGSELRARIRRTAELLAGLVDMVEAGRFDTQKDPFIDLDWDDRNRLQAQWEAGA